MKARILFILLTFVLSLAIPTDLHANASNPSQPVATEPDEDADGDGLTNQEEAVIGSLRENAYSDADSVADGEDAIPTDGDLKFARLAIPEFAIITLPTNFWLQSINSSAAAVGFLDNERVAWVAGGFRTIPVLPNGEAQPVTDSSLLRIGDNGKILSAEAFSNANGDTYDVVKTFHLADVEMVNTGTLHALSPADGVAHSFTSISPSGAIFGRSWKISDSKIKILQGNQQVTFDRAYLRGVGWLNNAQPTEYMGWPGSNDKTLLHMTYFGAPATVENAAGLDDNVNPLASNSTGKTVGYSWEYNGETDLNEFFAHSQQTVEQHALLWTTSTATPLSLATNAKALGINELNIANGLARENSILGGPERAVLWLGDLNWKTKDLPYYGPGNPLYGYYSFTMNSQGMGLLQDNGGSKIWLNGFTYDPATLAGLAPGSLWVENLTESGVMSGYKTDTVTGGVIPVIALPVNIQIKKKGTTSAPKDGVVVKVGDILEMKLSDIPQDTFPIPATNISWFIRKLLSVDDYTDWSDMGLNARGVKFEYTCVDSGIFQIKAQLVVGGQTITVIFDKDRDDPYTSGAFKLRKGDADSFGVAQNQIQIAIRDAAKTALGTRIYDTSNTVPAHGPFQSVAPNNHCNIFVAHKAFDGGAIVPRFNGLIPPYDPPAANQWAGILPDVNNPYYEDKMVNWQLKYVQTPPEPGFIAASGHSNWSIGHCGIVDYDGRWISAGDGVNRNATFKRYQSDNEGVKRAAGLRLYIGN